MLLLDCGGRVRFWVYPWMDGRGHVARKNACSRWAVGMVTVRVTRVSRRARQYLLSPETTGMQVWLPFINHPGPVDWW
jgi:hypothetical protein